MVTAARANRPWRPRWPSGPEERLLDGDDFYSPVLADLDPVERDRMTDAEATESVIDWRRLRTEALEPLVGAPPRLSAL